MQWEQNMGKNCLNSIFYKLNMFCFRLCLEKKKSAISLQKEFK